MLLANLVADPKQNGTCIGAEAKTLGEWQTYACNERTGAVICEMAKKRKHVILWVMPICFRFLILQLSVARQVEIFQVRRIFHELDHTHLGANLRPMVVSG